MKTADFLADCMEHYADTHRPYIYGTFGQILTVPLLEYKASQYPSRLGPARVKYAKEHYIGKRTDDCIGAIKNCYWLPGDNFDADPVYDWKTDWSADTTFAKAKVKGAISTIPKRRGICVRYPGHVGVLVDPVNMIVVEGRGFNYGCVRTKLSERRWTDWYEHPCFSYETKPVPTPTPKPSGGEYDVKVKTLKRNPDGSAMKDPNVLVFQSMMNTLEIKDDDGKSLEEDLSYGKRSEQACKRFQRLKGLKDDGVCGPLTWDRIANG